MPSLKIIKRTPSISNYYIFYVYASLFFLQILFGTISHLCMRLPKREGSIAYDSIFSIANGTRGIVATWTAAEIRSTKNRGGNVREALRDCHTRENGARTPLGWSCSEFGRRIRDPAGSQTMHGNVLGRIEREYSICPICLALSLSLSASLSSRFGHV